MPERLAAIVLDADTRIALVAVRCLSRAGRPVGIVTTPREAPSLAAASRYPRLRVEVPDPDDDEQGYVDAVLDLLDRRPAEVLIPASDRTVALLRKHRDQFTPRTALALASEPALESAVDKRSTLDAARELDLLVPRGVLVTDRGDLRHAHTVGFPCVVKPTVSWSAESGRLGRLTCRLATDVTELDEAVEAVLSSGAAALVQQWLPGRREAVHLLHAHGRTWALVCVAALRTSPALGGDSVMRMTVPLLADVADVAERLVRRLGLEGYAEVEFRRDALGRPALMEINPRLSASVETATRAGVDFPVLLHDWARGAPLTPVGGYRAGVRMRWVAGELRWLQEVRRNRGRPDVPRVPRAVAALLADTVRPAAYDVIDVRDPRPAARLAGKMFSARRRASVTGRTGR
jgi:predicted ATP-grasp superfamily ATP-dependent carboligase